jgi:phenylalanyl-tRNA synthetase alpha chain
LLEIETSILAYLKAKHSSDSEEIGKEIGAESSSVSSTLESLANEGFVKIEKKVFHEVSVTDEGREYLEQFPEEKLVSNLGSDGIEVGSSTDKIALMWAKKNGWIDIAGGRARLTAGGRKFLSSGGEYAQRSVLKLLSERKIIDDQDFLKNQEAIDALQKRKLIRLREYSKISASITGSGIGYYDRERAPSCEKAQLDQLTRQAISSGAWRNFAFKKYDMGAETPEVYPGRLHPVHEFINVIRNIWMRMGFTEGSGHIIEPAFWNFDALFSPQDHPTRDMQDTFFLSNPERINLPEKELVEKVKEMHKKNWGRRWSAETAAEAVLRTHTTSISAHYIKEYGNGYGAYPAKLFYVGKVFRNESIDYKHLAELYQYDGIIIGDDLGLSELIGTLKLFYSQLGGFKIKIKPSYFPFVEPGLEVEYFDSEHNDWIELCGGGVIRKEITEALGTDKSVLAWGGGLDRLMFSRLGMESLTDLYKNDVDWLRKRKMIADFRL